MEYTPFTKWRQRLWPIHRFEIKKIVPLFLLKFLFTVNFYLVGFAMKDSLVVAASGTGAEIIPILKGWIVLPCSILMLLILTKMSNRLSQEKLFYTVLSSFLAFFLLFGFVLYPLRETLSPTALSDWLLEYLGPERGHWVAVVRHWMNALFFVVAELWGTVVLVLMFWSFANNINRVSEAKRFYTLFVAAGNIAPIIAGFYTISEMAAGEDFQSSIQKMTLCSSIVIVLAMCIYWWMQKYVVTDPRLCSPDARKTVTKDKPKLSLMQSIKFVCSNRYLLCIGMLVIGYAFAMNMIEVTWKACMKLQYPDPNVYRAFMGKITIILGVATPPIAFLFGGNLMRKLGWYKTAMIPPILIGLTGVLFLSAYLMRERLGLICALFSMTPLYFIVMLGLIQNVTSKTMKFSLFDPTKEMAFIPLDAESKLKGKAAIDVVGSRLGKAGSSWTQLLFIEFFGMGAVLGTTHVILPVVILVIGAWLVSLKSLNSTFTKLTERESTLNSP